MLSLPPPGDLPDLGIEPMSHMSPALEGGFFTSSTTWEVLLYDGCSVAQLCLTLCNPMDCSLPGFPVHHQLLELAQTHIHPFNHVICCNPLLLPSIFPSIRVFSNELALCIRWPKYWRFSFNISPSNDYSRLISFRLDWFDLLALQGTLKSLNHSLKHNITV